ncbi:MAG: carboxypeptidase regulatory-like domain-containing protein [Sandaracinaceae bacterium]|nr:carboxypeptidase regulatory-like domain-containing protein [Sandaracinaceae bacterium]
MIQRCAICLVLLTACSVGETPHTTGDAGPGGRLDGDLGPGFDGGGGPRIDYASIGGTVWAPGNAPGMVAAGHEIPIFGALVRVTPTRQRPIPDMVYCEPCVAVEGPHVRTGHDGRFRLDNIVPGDYWLTVEKGQFRIERQISLGEGETLSLDATYTTLPNRHDAARGMTIPSIAIAAGSYDSLEDVFGKMGMGTVDGSGNFGVGPGSERIHFYQNGGTRYSGEMGTLGDLVRDLSRMLRYHVIFIPCSGSSNASALREQQVLRNLRDYVAAGGKLYVTDWSGEWMDNVFPAFVTLEGSGTDTPASAYDPAANTWNTSQFGDADGASYDSDNAEAVHPDLRAWLHGQVGPTPRSGVQTFDAGRFDVVDNWNTITALTRVPVGVDHEGLPVTNEPIGWVIGSRDASTPRRPLTVTFQPAGCGRVLYSTYHTTHTPHAGLVPQERILLYLIMEIGVCVEDPILI